MHGLHKRLDVVDARANGLLDLFARRKPWRPQPEVPYLPIFIGIGDAATFEVAHCRKGLLQRWRQRVDILGLKRAVAEVELDKWIVEHTAKTKITSEAVDGIHCDVGWSGW